MFLHRRKFLFAAIAAVAAIAFAPATSQATFTVTLSQSGFSDLVITDNDGNDENAATGRIEYSQDFGNFNLNTTLSRSNSQANVLPAELFISALSVTRLTGTAGGTAGEARTLTITLEDTAFNTPEGLKTLWTSLAGSVLSNNGVVTLQAFLDDVPGTKIQLNGTGGNAGGVEANNGPFAEGPYSLKLVMEITLQNRGDRYDGTGIANVVNYVPAPGGLIMLAGAVPFFGLLRRKLRKGEPTTAA